MPDNRELIVSSTAETEQELQARFQEWGYLYFKRYVQRPDCERILEDFSGALSPHISFEEATHLPTLNGRPFYETDAEWDETYPRIQALESFHSFFHSESIVDLMEKVSGSEVFVYPMKMARVSTPGKVGYETPPHQDAYSHHAGPTMAGIWVALHDIPQPLGRVKVLPQSHKGGVRKVFTAEGVGGVQCEIYPEETCWHVSDYEQGDVLIFHSATVHKAEPNTTNSSVRLSIDTRFCDYGAPVFSTNLEPHHGWRIEGLCWDNIYRGWQHKSNQYYWLDYPALF
jgi:ectoine hydroxylase-related dioxygenase (phytanoyl-CoA dioxygenase family)